MYQACIRGIISIRKAVMLAVGNSLGESFNARIHTFDDGIIRLQLVDVLKYATQTQNGSEVLKRVRKNFPNSSFIQRITGDGNKWQFPGLINPTHGVTYDEINELLSFFPPSNDVIAKHHAEMRRILTSVKAGDQRMHEEINNNAVSNGLENVLARNQLGIETVADNVLPPSPMSPMDRLLEEATKKQKYIDITVNIVGSCDGVLAKYCGGLDDRDKLMLKDMARNAIRVMQVGDKRPLLMDGDEEAYEDAYDETETITVQEECQALGKRAKPGDLITIGRTMAQRYRDAHGKEPGHSKRFVDGATRDVKLYTTADREMMRKVITEHFEGKV